MKIKKYKPPAELMRTVAAKQTAEEYAAALDTLPEHAPSNKKPILKAFLSAAAVLVIAVTVTTAALILGNIRQKQPKEKPQSPPASDITPKAPEQFIFIYGNAAAGVKDGDVTPYGELSEKPLSALISHECFYSGTEKLYGIFIPATEENKIYEPLATGRYKGFFFIPCGTEADDSIPMPTSSVAFSQAEIDSGMFYRTVSTAEQIQTDIGNYEPDIDGDGESEYVEQLDAAVSPEGNAIKDFLLYEGERLITEINTSVIINVEYLTGRHFIALLSGAVLDVSYSDNAWDESADEFCDKELTPQLAHKILKNFCEVYCLEMPDVPELGEYVTSSHKLSEYVAQVAGAMSMKIVLPKAENVVLNGVKISPAEYVRLCDYVAGKEAAETVFTGTNHVATPTAHSLMLDNRSILITKDSIIINRQQFKYDEEFLKPIHGCSLLNADEYKITVTYNGQTKELTGHEQQRFVTHAMEQWRPAAPECDFDVMITFNGQTMYYHTECTALTVNGGSFIGNTYNISTLLKLYFNYEP